jgi:hypothetical protein
MTYGLRIGIMAVVLASFSCVKESRPPEGVLTTDQMVEVMTDLYISEQKFSTLGIARDSMRQVFDLMEGRIFKNLNTTDSVFQYSLDYYMNRPRTLEMIYTALVDSLNLREQRMSSDEVNR